MSNNDRISELRAELKKLVSDWKPQDGFEPPNYVRETGMGQCVAIVDLRCGGYQWPHNPTVIGWKVCHGTRFESGMVLVTNPNDQGSVSTAILGAQAAADAAYARLTHCAPPSPVRAPEPGDPFSLDPES